LPCFLERRLERCDQVVRQIADEPDRVAEQDARPVLETPLARARVERGEELVLGEYPGAGQHVHQRALAGVGVADERNGVLLAAGRDPALLAGLPLAQARLQIANARADEPAVLFELGFAGTTRADTAADTTEVAPHLPQPRQRVFELRQLDLKARFDGTG